MCIVFEYVLHMSTVAPRGQKKVPEPLALELQVAVGHCVGARNQAQVLCKSSQSLSHLSISPKELF